MLLHEIIRPSERDSRILELNRTDFSDPKEFLQGAVIEMPAKHSFRVHVNLKAGEVFF